MTDKKTDAPMIEEFTPAETVYYAAFDGETGQILTCYDSSIHGANIPDGVLEMTNDEFMGHIQKSRRLKVDVASDPKVFVDHIPEPPSLDEIKAQAKANVIRWINGVTLQMRAGYPTDEVAAWTAKTAEARVIAGGGEAGPLIASEAALTGEPEADVASAVLAKATVYQTIIGKVSGLRRSTLAAIDAANDPAEVQAAVDAGLAAGTAEAANYGLSV